MPQKTVSKTGKRLVMDIDGTLCHGKHPGASYSDLRPRTAVVARLREYRKRGFTIVLLTSRQMRTYDCNLGLITANTVPVLMDWLKKHRIPYDELHIGKPWCGFEGFYVDDKTVRPDEFVSMPYKRIRRLLNIKGGASK